MTSNQPPNPGDDTGLPSGNPADSLPARTTPTWEIEVLLSGASAFALFQVYGVLQGGLFDLVPLLSPDMVGLATALGMYLMAGVMALALGFIAHLSVRAFWAAAVGLHSIDPSGSLSRTRTVGPVQRELLAARWARLPKRIAELDDWATIVFAMSLGIAKMMIGMIIGFAAVYALASGVTWLSGGAIKTQAATVGLFALLLAPFLVAGIVDNHHGKKNLPPAAWTARVIGLYSAAGMTGDNSLGVTMMSHRLSSGERSYKGMVATLTLTFSLLLIVIGVPIIERVGVGTLLRGQFPMLQEGQPLTLRGSHYLDRLPEGDALRSPVIPSEIVRPPFLRLFIPYVPYWHDTMLKRCIAGEEGAVTAREASEPVDWRLDAAANAAVLACMAKELPISLDGKPVTDPWVFADDRRNDQRGFVVMIDVRELTSGRHELAVAQPGDAVQEGEPDVPWRILFWR